MRIIVLLFLLLTSVSIRAQETCMQPDVNCDGYVNVNDLLGLLGYFGDEDLDGDGIWDDQDECVEDECGVCDGPGPQVLAVDTITFTEDSVFVEAINEWYVFEVPDTTFNFVCTNPGCTDPMAENFSPFASEDDESCVYSDPCVNGLTLMFDGYSYDLVLIGDQCWFAENLRTEHYSNGDAIPGELSDGVWQNTDLGAQAIYNNEESNLADNGRLYNWYAVDDARGLCPSGWYVTTVGDYSDLANFLGGVGIAGTPIKSSPSDSPAWDGTNTSGFSALAGGYRDGIGIFNAVGAHGYFWTSSPSFTAWRWVLESGCPGLHPSSNSSLQSGFSVRCIKD